jgi:hypothetical protein
MNRLEINEVKVNILQIRFDVHLIQTKEHRRVSAMIGSRVGWSHVK